MGCLINVASHFCFFHLEALLSRDPVNGPTERGTDGEQGRSIPFSLKI